MRDASRQSAYSFGVMQHQSQGYAQAVWVNLKRVLLFGLLVAGLNTAIAEEPRESLLTDRAASSLLLDITYAGDRLVAVGNWGHIIYSDDQGQQWTQAKVPTNKLLTAVYFADEKNGWVVGHDALILNTNDGGETWTQQYADLDAEIPLLDVWFKNLREGYVVGPYGYFMKTTDGGKTWIDWTDSIENEEELHFNSITSLQDGTIVISGEAGSLYRSLDDAESFEAVESPYDGSFFGVIPTTQAGKGFAYGLRGHLFRTEDQGETWQEIRTGTDYGLFGGQLLKDGSIIVVGDNGNILISNDHGESFTLKRRANRLYISSALQLQNGNLMLVGQGGIHTVASDGAELASQTK